MEDKRLFLLDAFALIYRAYFAFSKNPRINSKGQNTSAVYGFTSTLFDLLNKEKPTHIAVVFDTAAPTERHIEFTEYKAHREAMPEDIRSNIEWIKDVVRGFNIPVIGIDGYEADDVIGTLAKKAEKEGFTTYMVTPDKDYAQLVSDNIFMYRPPRGGGKWEKWGIPEICEKFEIERPEQVIDILGMMGDSADNIPGIPGVGEKRAKDLVKAYGSMEGLYENTHEIKGKLREKIEANKELAFLSKKLVTILLDAPCEFDEKSLQMDPVDKEALRPLFTDLEFRRLGERILGEEIKVADQQPTQGDLFAGQAEAEPAQVETTARDITTEIHSYQAVTTLEELDAMVAELQKSKAFCFDTETTGLDVYSDKVLGIAFSCKKGTGWYAQVPQENPDAFWEKIRTLLSGPQLKIAHNLKYDLALLRNHDVHPAGPYFDTMLAHYLINPDMRHGMDVLAETYLRYSPISITELIGKKGKNQLKMSDVTLEKVVEYATEDADITFQLYELFQKKLEKECQEKLFNEIEVPLVEVLMSMEANGICLDVQALNDYSAKLGTELEALVTKIHELAGKEFSISSPKQLGPILFEDLQLMDKPKKTKTGQYATGEEVLVKLKDKHPIVEAILDYRQMSKLKSTYVDALPTLVHEKTGLIHTSYNQAVAATGRLSSNNPNLQNIPIRSERGREVRKAFIPRSEEFTLLAADYSQVELRIIAALAKDELMIQAFRDKVDIHTATAAKVFGVELDEVDRDMRSKAKAVNFGIIYGQSAFSLSQQLGIKRKEAKEIIDTYFEKYSGIRDFLNSAVEKAKENGYVETVMGRRRYLPDIHSSNAIVRGFAERNAVNAPIQGSAADVIKKAMIDIHAYLKQGNYKTKMLLQVHDELVFDLHRDEAAELKPIIKQKMENAFQLSVPLEVEMEEGPNWLEAH